MCHFPFFYLFEQYNNIHLIGELFTNNNIELLYYGITSHFKLKNISEETNYTSKNTYSKFL